MDLFGFMLVMFILIVVFSIFAAIMTEIDPFGWRTPKQPKYGVLTDEDEILNELKIHYNRKE